MMTPEERYSIPDHDAVSYRRLLGLSATEPVPVDVYRKHADVLHACERLQMPGRSLTQKEMVLVAAMAGCLPCAPPKFDPADPKAEKSKPALAATK